MEKMEHVTVLASGLVIPWRLAPRVRPISAAAKVRSKGGRVEPVRGQLSVSMANTNLRLVVRLC